MILFINTLQTDLIQVKLIDGGKIVGSLESKEEYKQSELLLGIIDKLLKDQSIKVKDLDKVAVVSGPGAFSALRFGITTANALAWSLSIPVIEVSIDEAFDDQKLIKILEEKTKNLKLKAKTFIPIVANYGKEPNITGIKNNE
ncbi:MAG: tRNA (adenosine(37)-N6)-threonylcarbamoyltransferase complex dimerization subunit type 1 TsaB [Patescibacteria group bacterium]|jgi:tRNA threonylcarbamoyl adenosine modification protein YeaZ